MSLSTLRTTLKEINYGVVCPSCHGKEVIPFGKSKFRCEECGKEFSEAEAKNENEEGKLTSYLMRNHQRIHPRDHDLLHSLLADGEDFESLIPSINKAASSYARSSKPILKHSDFGGSDESLKENSGTAFINSLEPGTRVEFTKRDPQGFYKKGDTGTVIRVEPIEGSAQWPPDISVQVHGGKKAYAHPDHLKKVYRS